MAQEPSELSVVNLEFDNARQDEAQEGLLVTDNKVGGLHSGRGKEEASQHGSPAVFIVAIDDIADDGLGFFDEINAGANIACIYSEFQPFGSIVYSE